MKQPALLNIFGAALTTLFVAASAVGVQAEYRLNPDGSPDVSTLESPKGTTQVILSQGASDRVKNTTTSVVVITNSMASCFTRRGNPVDTMECEELLDTWKDQGLFDHVFDGPFGAGNICHFPDGRPNLKSDFCRDLYDDYVEKQDERKFDQLLRDVTVPKPHN